LEKQNLTAKEKFINLSTKLYLGNSTAIITICWIVASFHLTMIYNYQDCINSHDEKNAFISIPWLALTVIFIVYVPIITYFFVNRETIGREKDNRIEERNGSFGFADTNPKVFILPMYLLWVFSLSKLIVIFYEYYTNRISEDIIVKIAILLTIFIGSLWAWIKFKKTSTKIWSFWITLFAISYVVLNIYWEYFLPYLQSYLSSLNCVFKTIIMERTPL